MHQVELRKVLLWGRNAGPSGWRRRLILQTVGLTLALLAGCFNAPGASIVRGPYLQLATPTSIVVRWRTDVASMSRVVYGTNLQGALSLVDLPDLVTDHEVQLTNLAPDTVYYYGVGTDQGTLAGPDSTCYFRTHPLPGTSRPLHLWVIGDAGTATTDQAAVRNAFYAVNGANHVDALLQLGDNAYYTGSDSEYQAAFFDMYSVLLRRTVTWPTLGNHDTYAADTNGWFPYLGMFTLPMQAEAGGVPSGTERYYSFDLGQAHFVCLDSVTSSLAPDGPMALWLQADLAANTNQWVVAYWHYPPYSKGGHDSDTEFGMIEMRQNFVPILEAGGVDLVLCGHSHDYERSYLLDGHYGFSTNLTPGMILSGGNGRETNGVGAYLKPERHSGPSIAHGGAVYAIVGSSGWLYCGTLNHPVMAQSFCLLGSMVLDITSNRLDAVFLRETGETNDWFSIVKTNLAPVASNLTFTVAADVPSTLALKAGDPNRDALTFLAWTRPTNGLLSGPDPATGAATYTPARGCTNGDSFSFAASDAWLTGSPAVVTISLVPPADTNSNGLADDWEALYGISDPNGDADGDGATNLQEYLAGTNPTNALSRLCITQIIQRQAGTQLQWSVVGGTRYRVLYSDGDAHGGAGGFIPIPRTVEQEMNPGPEGVPGTMEFTDDGSLTGGLPVGGFRFYRIQVVR